MAINDENIPKNKNVPMRWSLEEQSELKQVLYAD